MIQVGQNVYIVPDDTRQIPYYATVAKIGTKYITTYGNYRFNIDSHRSVDDYSGYNPRLNLYESKEAYEEFKYKNDRKNHLIKEITKIISNITLDKLEYIYSIIR